MGVNCVCCVLSGARPSLCFVALLRDDELAKDAESAEASERAIKVLVCVVVIKFILKHEHKTKI
jgi:hypothetical protein